MPYIPYKEPGARHYIWETAGWQDFKPLHYQNKAVLESLAEARFVQGELLGRIAGFDLTLQNDAESDVLIAETLQTSKIEGVELNPQSVRSSVAAMLGFPQGIGTPIREPHTEGIVEILLDAVRNSDAPLSLKRLNGWHAAMFPTGYSGISKIHAGVLRKGKMMVVSGRIGAEKVHFCAPPADAAKQELAAFIRWFNGSFGKEDGLLRAAAAHLKFVTIHPYEDGNGRLSRALTDMAVSQDEKKSFRSYSLSAEIMRERAAYYQILEDVQTCKADVSDWFLWFLVMFKAAIANSREIIANAFYKAAFWNRIKDISINDRQRKVLHKMLAQGPDNFEGGLTTRKYVSMAQVSPATAFREIEDMRDKGILTPHGKGRSVRYQLSNCIDAGTRDE